MRRTQIYLDEEQGERLAAAAAEAGTTVSALIREAINAHLDADGAAGTRLGSLRAALADAAGCAPGLQSGAEYVDRVRPDYGERERSMWRRGG